MWVACTLIRNTLVFRIEMKPLMASIAHSGEEVSPLATWLKDQPEEVLLCDLDRFVDKLYEPVLKNLNLPTIRTSWSRYNMDCNRRPDDLDSRAVEIEGAKRTSDYGFGLYWLTTTKGHPLIKKPISEKEHKALFELCYKPFHKKIEETIEKMKQDFKEVYHVDLHSMPSQATKVHSDTGKMRPEVTISNNKGLSCCEFFTELVVKSYKDVGFEVSLNWPYEGGGMTTLYGKPQKNQHTLQIELNRKLYMDETTKKPLKGEFERIQERLSQALTKIYRGLSL